MARVALQPREMHVQKRSRPIPNGLTAPMPVIATLTGAPFIPLALLIICGCDG
jgi:hypothetical protein